MNEFADEFVHLLTDPAHTAVEFVFVFIDVMIISKYRDWRHGHKKGKEE